MSISHKYTCALVCALGLLSASQTASAEATQEKQPRVITTASAWLPKAGTVFLMGGFDQTIRPSGYASIGLGGVAELGLSLDRQRSEPGQEAKLALAHFKMGTPEGFGHRFVPAVALSYRKTLPSEVQFISFSDTFEVAVLGAVMSKRMGPVSLHIGAELFSAEDETTGKSLNKVIRPTLGLEWHPSDLPLTTLVADVHWLPGESEGASLDTRWNAAWGVRYQSLDWASIDLNLRLQESESISDAIITLSLTGSFSVLNPELSLERTAEK